MSSENPTNGEGAPKVKLPLMKRALAQCVRVFGQERMMWVLEHLRLVIALLVLGLVLLLGLILGLVWWLHRPPPAPPAPAEHEVQIQTHPVEEKPAPPPVAKPAEDEEKKRLAAEMEALRAEQERLKAQNDALKKQLQTKRLSTGGGPSAECQLLVNSGMRAEDFRRCLREALGLPAQPAPAGAKDAPVAGPAPAEDHGAAKPGASSEAKSGAKLATGSWAYSGAQGPQAWAQLKPEYALCGQGQQQAPMALDSRTVTLAKPGTALPFKLQAAPPQWGEVEPNQLWRRAVVSGQRVQWGSSSYALKQIELHIPGEVQINGEQAVASLHLLHESAAPTPKGQGQSLIWVWPLAVAEHGDSKLEFWLQPWLEAKNSAPLDLLRLEQWAAGAQYQYAGSLSQPPCTENVTWVVLKNSLHVSSSQLTALKQRLGPANARPMQEAHGRAVTFWTGR